MNTDGVDPAKARTRAKRPMARAFLILLVAVSLVHLLSQLMAPGGILSDVTQVLLMPMLGGLILGSTSAPRTPVVRLALAAVFFSWLGDAIPRVLDGDRGFLTMVGCFLVAQVFYILLLRRWWRGSILRRPVWLAPYAVALVVLVIVCSPAAGSLLVPVVIYGLALASMAVLSTGLGPKGAVGGAIFFLSDSMIALGSFTQIQLPAKDFWIMLTYILGQYLLVRAIVGRDKASAQRAIPQAAAR